MPRTLLLATTLGLALIALVQTARIWLRSVFTRSALRRRVGRAVEGERRAEGLLRARGFEVVARQARARWAVQVDGDAVPVDLRADLLVTRDGRTFVAEVKTGKLAPRIGTPATRRQLLEYRIAFAVDGVLLVDAESDAVREVEFALPDAASGVRDQRALPWLLVGLAAGMAGSYAAERFVAARVPTHERRQEK